jgi:hypothetical protein
MLEIERKEYQNASIELRGSPSSVSTARLVILVVSNMMINTSISGIDHQL